jgi:hypothetical protein
MTVLGGAFRFIFGCRHRHLSRIFTIKRRTYRVCFDCGREFDLPDVTAKRKGNPISCSSLPQNRNQPAEVNRQAVANP